MLRLAQDLCDKVLKEVGKIARVAGKCMKEVLEFLKGSWNDMNDCLLETARAGAL